MDAHSDNIFIKVNAKIANLIVLDVYHYTIVCNAKEIDSNYLFVFAQIASMTISKV